MCFADKSTSHKKIALCIVPSERVMRQYLAIALQGGSCGIFPSARHVPLQFVVFDSAETGLRAICILIQASCNDARQPTAADLSMFLAARLFVQLVDLFRFYMLFPIDDHTGDPVTDEEVTAAHYEKVQQVDSCCLLHTCCGIGTFCSVLAGALSVLVGALPVLAGALPVLVGALSVLVGALSVLLELCQCLLELCQCLLELCQCLLNLCQHLLNVSQHLHTLRQQLLNSFQHVLKRTMSPRQLKWLAQYANLSCVAESSMAMAMQPALQWFAPVICLGVPWLQAASDALQLIDQLCSPTIDKNSHMRTWVVVLRAGAAAVLQACTQAEGSGPGQLWHCGEARHPAQVPEPAGT